ncbi:MAG: class I SAM-dependent methyltransferase [Oscillospiraceae bacterium]|jgi:SAM-dependent methyltransferase|nr:class I SAM-dependent methyltransferase [Oscillospiraceae bacterium]
MTALGIEPSKYFLKVAKDSGIPLISPEELDPAELFDAVYLTDVIEHVSEPLSFVKFYAEHLRSGGVMFVTTPNVSSPVAKILGKRWWHYRIAHIGYFNKKTLNALFESAGLELVKYLPVRWYFSMDYILERLSSYLPILKGKHFPRGFGNVIIPVNFGDSILAVYKKSFGGDE